MTRKAVLFGGVVTLSVFALFPLFAKVRPAVQQSSAGKTTYYHHQVGPYFRPDYLLKGSSLAGWHTLGQAKWTASNGVITGTPTQSQGGWLVLDKSMQDVDFYAYAHCTAGCDSGVLLRMQKTANGIKGVYASFKQGDLGLYAVTLDAEGHFLSRTPLSAVPRESHMGGIPNPNIQRYYGGKFPLKPMPMPANLNKVLPLLHRPTGAYRPGMWNGVDIFLIGQVFQRRFNGGGLGASPHPGSLLYNVNDAVKYSMGNYGPVALYVGGTSPVHLKDVAYKNELVRTIPHEYVGSNWTQQRLNPWYYSWSASVADFNHDGVKDIVAGPYIYLGPNYTKAIEFMNPVTYNPTTDYSQGSMVEIAYDFQHNGWPDILVDSGNAGVGTATLYVNPRGQSRRWKHYVVIPKCGNEFTMLGDLFSDGRPVIIHAGDFKFQYSYPNPANPTGFWITKDISKPGPWGVYIGHGFGIGDINGDGRKDLVSPYGWWEQPPNALHTNATWKYHPVQLGRWGHSQGGPGGSMMDVYDVNGDGLNDVVTSLEGHGFGLAWYEQKRSSTGKISFVRHMIMGNFLDHNAGNVTFAELHSLNFADIYGNGLTDIIVGKRSMSHLASTADPDPLGAPVLYVYKLVRDPKAPGGARFVPEMVSNDAGVGSTVTVADLNGNGKPDIITSGALGTFIFWNHEK